MSIGKLNAVDGISRETPIAGTKAEAKDPRLDQVAKLYEQQFMQEMVKAMRGTVSASEITKPSMAENIYRDQLDDQYVEAWSSNGGVGLADIIYTELAAKYGSQKPAAFQKAGPITLTDRDISRVTRPNQSQSGQMPMRIELKDDQSGSPAKVQAPWEGRLLAQTRVDGRSTILLEHQGGLRSALIFDGVPTGSLKTGETIQKGTPIGILSPEIKSFFWNLNMTQGSQAPEIDSAKISRLESDI